VQSQSAMLVYIFSNLRNYCAVTECDADLYVQQSQELLCSYRVWCIVPGNLADVLIAISVSAVQSQSLLCSFLKYSWYILSAISGFIVQSQSAMLVYIFSNLRIYCAVTECDACLYLQQSQELLCSFRVWCIVPGNLADILIAISGIIVQSQTVMLVYIFSNLRNYCAVSECDV
jgi:hypothetical protein